MKISDEMLAAYYENEVTPSEHREIQRCLDESPDAQRRLARIKETIEFLREPTKGEEQTDLLQLVRQELLLSRPPARTLSRWLTPIAAFAIAAAALMILVGRVDDGGSSGEFRVKSAGSYSEQDAWVGIGAYLAAEGAPTPLTATMPQSMGLVFSYTNLEKSTFRHLMIFAIGEQGNVHWFYPAYEHLGSDPKSMVIRVSGEAIELPDIVHHDYTFGLLTIYGVFSETPMRVSEIEKHVASLVAEGRWDAHHPTRLALPRTGQHILKTKVVP